MSAATGLLLTTIESRTDKRWGLLNRPTESGGDEAWRMEESRAETLPFPLVPAMWHVGRL